MGFHNLGKLKSHNRINILKILLLIQVALLV